MKSMTGYAFRENLSGDVAVSVEIKSYNSRFLDLSVNLPYWLGRIENRLREYTATRVQRGKVELSVKIKERGSSLVVTPDPEAARAYLEAITEIAKAIGHQEKIPLSLIVGQEGVLKTERSLDMDAYWLMIAPVLENAFTDFELCRETEGAALTVDIMKMIDRLESDADAVSLWIPEMERLFKDNIRGRFIEVVGNGIDEQRVLQETAALMVKYTINEEIVRLRAHLASLKKELAENQSPGRKADFICQEINREINTIGSKNQILEVGQAVIDAKDALENIREQMRNIE
jgi:uncharacterized protein (TIGR00255 family)